MSDRMYEANDMNEKLNLEQNEKLNTDKKKIELKNIPKDQPRCGMEEDFRR